MRGQRRGGLLRKLRLTNVLVGGAILAAVAPALVLTVGSAKAIRQIVTDQTTTRDQLLAQSLANQYEQFLTAHRQIVVALAADIAAMDLPSPAALSRRLEHAGSPHPAFRGFHVVDVAGRIIAVD
ncbi:MAG TPA: hypothetical protein VMT79_16595, partial [Candidatus Binatia bacterium]|nr:hypothetical protein [Candidatus Binatia bacterium]